MLGPILQHVVTQTTSSSSGRACLLLAASSIGSVFFFVLFCIFCGPKSALSVGLKSSLKDVTIVESEKQFLSSCGLSFIGRENIAPNSVTLYPVVFLPV